jgi:hypothetical protein
MLKKLNLILFVSLLFSIVKVGANPKYTFAKDLKYIFDVDEGLLKGSPTTPRTFEGIPVKYISSRVSAELRDSTYFLAQTHPDCQKSVKEVINSVTQRFPMILEERNTQEEKKFLSFLLDNLGDMSATDLYVRHPRNVMKLNQPIPGAYVAPTATRKEDVMAYEESLDDLLEDCLAAIIYNTSKDQLENYLSAFLEENEKKSAPLMLNKMRRDIEKQFSSYTYSILDEERTVPPKIYRYYDKDGKVINGSKAEVSSAKQ